LTTNLINGELVYSEGISTNGVNLIPNGYYYINVKSAFTASGPAPFNAGNATIISFHRTYNDAITEQNPIPFINESLVSSDYQHRISIRARAIPTMVNEKIRTIKPTLRFDRTSYKSAISEWVSNQYYSSPYISIGNDTSNTIKLFASVDSGNRVPTGGTGTGAAFSISNVLLGGTYYAEIIDGGQNYTVNDVLRINGSSLGGFTASVMLSGTVLQNSSIIKMTNTSGINVGDYVSGYGIPYGTTVKSKLTNDNIMISEPATATGLGPLLFLSGNIPNDCLLQVQSVAGDGEITSVFVYGVATDASLSSLQGAVLPILNLTNDNGNAVATLDYSYSDLKPGQINGSYMYFYKTHGDYLYDDTGKNFIGSISGTTLQVDAIEAGVSLAVGDKIYNKDISGPCEINSFGTGTGGIGTYIVSSVQNITTTQFNTGGGAIIRISRPKFDPNKINNLYYMQILNSGFIYDEEDTIIISGSLLGGVNGVNDAKITVQGVTVDNGIFNATIEGIAVGEFSQYYVKPMEYDASTQTGTVAVYQNTQMTIPVTYSSFIWDGSGNSYGYLPEPIVNNYSYGYNVSSIVIYQGFIWQCIEANNDNEFDPAKWYPLMSSDVGINALDRIEAYYSPTIDMPGKDAQQLVKGITYPNNVYYGNAFAPEDMLPLDTIVQSQPFYPVGVNVKAITYAANTYVAVAETAEATLILTLSETGVWTSSVIANKPMGVSDIIYAESAYVVTTTSTENPIYLSWDGIDWVSYGKVTGFDVLNWDQSGLDASQVGVANVPLKSVVNVNGTFYAAGNQILKSDDGFNWTESYRFFSNRLQNTINDITYVDNVTFVGFVAVGTGYQVIANGGTSSPTISSQSRIVTSLDGTIWNLLEPNLSVNGFNSVSASSALNRIVLVGDSAEVWYSSNASNWLPGNILGSPLTANIKSVVYGNSIFVAVGEKTGNQSTDPAAILTSVDGITWTQVSSQFITTNNLNYVYFSEGFFYATGENDTIIKSSNGTVWVDISSVSVDEPYYVVQGNDFLYGYGPEELVAGVVTDTLSMYVNTAPGAYWDIDFNTPIWYKHTGFNMKTVAGYPNLDLEVSFTRTVVNPARLSVFIVDSQTNKGVRIYENISSDNHEYYYSVNWMQEKIILNQPLLPNHYILIEVYEVGNGKELIRNNSKNFPLRDDPITGESYFEFNIQYEPVINEPLVYASVSGGELNKLEYNVDYYLGSTNQGFMKLVFATQVYNPNTDYIVFSILGNNTSVFNTTQYGYSIPETQVFVAEAATSDFALDLSLSNLDGDNIPNSIVELNGKRLVPFGTVGADYEFRYIDNVWYLHLYISVGGSSSDTVSITTFYDTSRQYLTTNLYTTVTLGGITTTKITFVDISKTPVQLTFESDPNFNSGDLIRIDGIRGTTELNQMSFYVDKVSATEYLLYKDSSLTYPISGPELSNFKDFGYAWLDEETILIPYPTVPAGMPNMTYDDGSRAWITINGDRLLPSLTNYSASAEFTGHITGTVLTVTSISNGKLNIGQEIFGGSVAPNTVIVGYISGLGYSGTYEVSVSQTVSLTNMNTDYNNRLSVLSTTSPSDYILVTSMVSGESPNEMSFDVYVDKYNQGTVYRINSNDGSWLTQDFNFSDTTMHFYNVRSLVDVISTDLVVLQDYGITFSYIQCDINEVKGISVYNKDTMTTLAETQFGITLFNGKPAVIFSSGAASGDNVTITITIGNIVEINGERIKFDEIDIENNTITKLTRGVQGTSAANLHEKYSTGYGINPARQLTTVEYTSIWNSAEITDRGDPLQISTTDTAVFLQNNASI